MVRTVCLSEIYIALSAESFTQADKQLQATVNLADLKIADGYPASLGSLRRIKQISVTLPALTGPYYPLHHR